uniref:hypothetical protein n=1 Tax=Citrobacter rodentium TaxID=67825 RepID=UPI003D81BC24
MSRWRFFMKDTITNVTDIRVASRTIYTPLVLSISITNNSIPAINRPVYSLFNSLKNLIFTLSCALTWAN